MVPAAQVRYISVVTTIGLYMIVLYDDLLQLWCTQKREVQLSLASSERTKKGVKVNQALLGFTVRAADTRRAGEIERVSETGTRKRWHVVLTFISLVCVG